MKYKTVDEWSLKQAEAEHEKFPTDLPNGPMDTWTAFRLLESLQQEFEEKSSGRTILAAVKLCAQRDLVMPEWLAEAFISKYNLVSRYREKSWDDVFEKPHPKGANLNARRKKWEKEYKVYFEISRCQSSIDKSLFRSVGKKFGLGATLAEEYYYAVKKNFPMTPNSKSSRSRKSRK